MIVSANQSQSLGPRIRNKKARFEYEILEKHEAGLSLKGSEVKSLRAGRASLEEAYVRIQSGEGYLVGAHIAPYEQAGRENHEPLRTRRLLMHRRELLRLESKSQQKGLTVIPISIYFKRGYAKLQIGLARGRSRFDKRQALRKRQDRREMERFKKSSR